MKVKDTLPNSILLTARSDVKGTLSKIVNITKRLKLFIYTFCLSFVNYNAQLYKTKYRINTIVETPFIRAR